MMYNKDKQGFIFSGFIYFKKITKEGFTNANRCAKTFGENNTLVATNDIVHTTK